MLLSVWFCLRCRFRLSTSYSGEDLCGLSSGFKKAGMRSKYLSRRKLGSVHQTRRHCCEPPRSKPPHYYALAVRLWSYRCCCISSKKEKMNPKSTLTALNLLLFLFFYLFIYLFIRKVCFKFRVWWVSPEETLSSLCSMHVWVPGTCMIM